MTWVWSLAVSMILSWEHQKKRWQLCFQKHFGYRVGITSHKIQNTARATCKICKPNISNCGGTMNLLNHLHTSHSVEYSQLVGTGTANNESQQVIDHYRLNSPVGTWNVKKLSYSLARAKKLTESIAEFIVANLRLVSVVDGDRFLNLMQVAELRYVVPCFHTIDNTMIDKVYCSSKQRVCYELNGVVYLGMTTDMWNSRSYVAIYLRLPTLLMRNL